MKLFFAPPPHPAFHASRCSVGLDQSAPPLAMCRHSRTGRPLLRRSWGVYARSMFSRHFFFVFFTRHKCGEAGMTQSWNGTFHKAEVEGKQISHSLISVKGKCWQECVCVLCFSFQVLNFFLSLFNFIPAGNYIFSTSGFTICFIINHRIRNSLKPLGTQPMETDTVKF